MDDTQCRMFFEDAGSTPYHRQYEALRAVFVDGRTQVEVARRFGYADDSFRQLVRGFRRVIGSGSRAPFFNSPMSAGQAGE